LTEEEFQATAKKFAEDNAADLFIYKGPFDLNDGFKAIRYLSDFAYSENLNFYLLTSGGDADAAYQMARFLQRKYKKIILHVIANCKSAGTLLAIAANEIVMAETGELGPLDVQLIKTDHLWDRDSGLNVIEALDSLDVRTRAFYEKMFLDLQRNSNGTISLKTASSMANSLTKDLYGVIYSQIEPTHFGEVSRAMKIAEKYAERLEAKSKNLKEDARERLSSSYPSHSFCIDKEEAKDIFKNVRDPLEPEKVFDVFLLKNLRNSTFSKFYSSAKALEQ
jgi:hypothetical protein